MERRRRVHVGNWCRCAVSRGALLGRRGLPDHQADGPVHHGRDPPSHRPPVGGGLVPRQRPTLRRPFGVWRLFRPLLELRDQFFDLQLEAFQRRKQLRLELPLQLLSFFQEVFYQVAEALGQLAPCGDGVHVGVTWLLGGQGIHELLLALMGGVHTREVYALGQGRGFAAAPPVAKRARSWYLLRVYASTRLRVYASVRLGVRDRWPSG